MCHSVSPPLEQGIRFPKASQPRPPTACLTVSLPRGRRTWGSTFRTTDPVSNLGESSTPVVRQFRASSYKTCNLTTCANTRKHSLDLLIPVGPFSVTTLTDFRLISPYCSTLALNPVGLGKGSPPHGFDPIRYIVGRASHPVITRRQHAILRYWQEHARFGQDVKSLPNNQLCDFVSRYNDAVSGEGRQGR